jgi:hypothetical protein
MVVDFGQLPNATAKTVPHGINFTSQFTATRIYGASTDPTALQYLSLPYVAIVPANSVEMFIDATNVNIITGSNRSTFTRTTVVIEYIKNL